MRPSPDDYRSNVAEISEIRTVLVGLWAYAHPARRSDGHGFPTGPTIPVQRRQWRRTDGGKFKTRPLTVPDRTRMEISDKLLCLFNADVEAEADRFVVEVPRREVDTGAVEADDTYRVALIRTGDEEDTEVETDTEPSTAPDEPQPPVERGEIRYVEVEDLGKQGDGIARVERGYVIIVPGAEVGERVKVEITEVKSNFAVGEILE